MEKKTLILTLAMVAVGALACGEDESSPAFEAVETTELSFVNHLQAGLIEQDVFVESVTGEVDVVRVAGEPLAPEVLESAVYATAYAVPHDPFGIGASPMGPFAKGPALGMTMGEWLSARGTAMYQVADDGRARLSTDFEGLIPRGTYTLWCSRLTFPPEQAIIDYPCGELDGSTNTFVADDNGRASVELDTWAMPASTSVSINVVGLAYHSDDRTYGPSPGAFGMNSHVQVFAMFPAPLSPVE